MHGGGGGGGFIAYMAEFIREGGPAMYINIGFLAISLAIIIERFIQLFFRFNVNATTFMTQVEKLVLTNNLERAVKLCNSAPHAALPRVIKAGLSRANRGAVAVASALEEAIMEVTPYLTKRVQALWSLANIATLTGLIGTVFGLIGAFRAVAVAAPDQRQTVLTKSLSEAMNNTAFGLTIAVICIVFHLVLSGFSKKLLEDVEFNALRLENLLTRRAQGELNAAESAGAAPRQG
ncbi:MAG: MotA/TolQ/ExbB proton channel family protein [Myxococcota bacterium]